MADRYRVTVTVGRLSGHCAAGHKEGDTWVVENVEKPLSICPVALTAIWQKIYAMLFGAVFPFGPDDDTAFFSCPDNGYVKFKITRDKIE